MVNLGLIQ